MYASSQLTSQGRDIVVLESAPDGSKVIWATQLGGTGAETPRAVTVDSLGDVYVAGELDGESVTGVGISIARGTRTVPQGSIAKLSGADGRGIWGHALALSSGSDGTGRSAAPATIATAASRSSATPRPSSSSTSPTARSTGCSKARPYPTRASPGRRASSLRTDRFAGSCRADIRRGLRHRDVRNERPRRHRARRRRDRPRPGDDGCRRRTAHRRLRPRALIRRPGRSLLRRPVALTPRFSASRSRGPSCRPARCSRCPTSRGRGCARRRRTCAT